MHALYAVDPTILNNWNDIRYLLEKFGYEKGALLANIPKEWFRMVYEACQRSDISQMDFKRIEALLSQSKFERSVKIGYKINHSYNRNIPWIDNILLDVISNNIDAVITNVDVDDSKVINYCDPSSDTKISELFDGLQDASIKQTASDIARSAEYLIKSESIINLIDPYFRPRQKNTKILYALADIVSKQKGQPAKIRINCSYDSFIREASSFDEENIIYDYSKLLKNLIDIGWSYEIRFWSSSSEGDGDIHARFLITNKGGLTYDRGFVEPDDREKREKYSHVQTIGKQFARQILDTYNATGGRLRLMESIMIQ